MLGGGCVLLADSCSSRFFQMLSYKCKMSPVLHCSIVYIFWSVVWDGVSQSNQHC